MPYQQQHNQPESRISAWTKLSNIVSANDADGDSIEGIRFSFDELNLFSVYSQVKEHTSIVMSPTSTISMMCISSRMMDITILGHLICLYTTLWLGVATTTVDIEFGAIFAPELQSVSDGSIIGGTLITTIVPMNDGLSMNTSTITMIRMMTTRI